MSRILVTGGAGFIGSHLAHRLVEQGHSVRVLDNFLTGKRDNLKEILDQIELIEGDLRDLATCRAATADIDVVLHQAARPSVPLSVETPQLSHDININGTFNLLLAAKDARVKRPVGRFCRRNPAMEAVLGGLIRFFFFFSDFCNKFQVSTHLEACHRRISTRRIQI